MTTQYTPILKLALPVTGELSGTWGDVVNDNITSMVEQAIAGLATISTWTGNSHTLTTANGTTSESRCAMLVAQDGAGLTAAGEIVCPASSKLYVLKNATSYTITLKTAAGTGVAVVSGNTAFLFCDGTNVNACVTTIVDGRVTGNLTVDGNATVNGNTTLGNATSDTITATARFASDLVPSADNTRDLGSTANSWKDLYIDGTAYLALVDINGGTIDGVSIGASTAATIINVDNLRLDGNTISSTDTNGNVVIAPNGTGDVQLDADTVRVGDSGAAVTLTSNGAGALTVTTGGAADLTLSTNSGTTSGTIVIANGANGNITLTPDGTGDVILSADRVQIGDANTDTTLTTNGTGNLNLTTNNGTNSGTIQIAQGANGNITLTPNGTGSVSVPKLVWSNGTATRVPYLTTGGQFTDSANLTFNGTTLTANTLSLTTALAIASGGTNATATPTAGAVAYGTGTAYAFTSAGTSGQILTSSGAGAPIWTSLSSVGVTTFSAGTTGLTPSSATSGAITLAGTLNVANGGTGITSLTAGYIPFGAGTSAFASAGNLFYDSANVRLGVGGTSPATTLSAIGATATTLGLSISPGGWNNARHRLTVPISGDNSVWSFNWNGAAVDFSGYATSSITIGQGNVYIAVGPTNTAPSNVAAFSTNLLAVTGAVTSTADSTFAGVVRVGRGGSSVITNTAVGFETLNANTSGTQNTAVGYQTLKSNQTGSWNTALGLVAMNANESGTYNTGLGYVALSGNISGSFNTAVGASALPASTSASFNTAVGYYAGYTTNSSGNTLVGYYAGYQLTGAENTVIGSNAGRGIATGAYGVFIGPYSGAYNGAVGVSGSLNVNIGYSSGQYMSGAANLNTYVGSYAGQNMTTGSKNTILGAYNGNQGGLDIRTANNYIVLSDGDGNPRMFWNGANAQQSGALMVTGANRFYSNSTTGASPGYWKLGNVQLSQSRQAVIRLLGATSYSAGSAIAAVGVIQLRMDNGNNITGTWWNEGAVGSSTFIDVIVNSSTGDVFARLGAYQELAVECDASDGVVWSPALTYNSAVGSPPSGTTIPYGVSFNNNSTAVAINAYGIGLTDTAVSGFGIRFPATQSASSNANTLDDYEEGTWTPQLIGGTVAGTASLGSGYYTKIGNVVTVFFRFENVSKPSGASGDAIIAGLPFSIDSTNIIYSYGAPGLIYTNGGTSITAPNWSIRSVDAGSFDRFYFQYQTNVNANVSSLNIADLGATGNYFRGYFSYQTST